VIRVTKPRTAGVVMGLGNISKEGRPPGSSSVIDTSFVASFASASHAKLDGIAHGGGQGHPYVQAPASEANAAREIDRRER
jgi:hypothetical protein